jgi:hypothetical protein
MPSSVSKLVYHNKRTECWQINRTQQKFTRCHMEHAGTYNFVCLFLKLSKLVSQTESCLTPSRDCHNKWTDKDAGLIPVLNITLNKHCAV